MRVLKPEIVFTQEQLGFSIAKIMRVLKLNGLLINTILVSV